MKRIERQRQQLINTLESQENPLKYLIGMDSNTEISLPENTFEVTTHALVDETINIENRTEIKLLEKQSELLTLNKKATEAQGYANLSLTANYGYLGMGDNCPWFQSYAGA